MRGHRVCRCGVSSGSAIAKNSFSSEPQHFFRLVGASGQCILDGSVLLLRASTLLGRLPVPIQSLVYRPPFCSGLSFGLAAGFGSRGSGFLAGLIVTTYE